MKAQTHRRNIPSDYSLVQRPIKSPNLTSGGRDYLEISGEKEINLQTALERLRCTQDSQPFKGQLKAATWPLWVLGCDTVPKAPASHQLCPPPIPSNAVCFHLHFLSSWVWKLINSHLKNTRSPSYSWKMVRSGNPRAHSQVNYQLEESNAPLYKAPDCQPGYLALQNPTVHPQHSTLLPRTAHLQWPATLTRR